MLHQSKILCYGRYVAFVALADACFLCAEAKVKFNLGSKDAQSYYEEGIRASFEENGLSASLAAYMAQEGIAWGTSHKGFYDTRN